MAQPSNNKQWDTDSVLAQSEWGDSEFDYPPNETNNAPLPAIEEEVKAPFIDDGNDTFADNYQDQTRGDNNYNADHHQQQQYYDDHKTNYPTNHQQRKPAVNTTNYSDNQQQQRRLAANGTNYPSDNQQQQRPHPNHGNYRLNHRGYSSRPRQRGRGRASHSHYNRNYNYRNDSNADAVQHQQQRPTSRYDSLAYNQRHSGYHDRPRADEPTYNDYRQRHRAEYYENPAVLEKAPPLDVHLRDHPYKSTGQFPRHAHEVLSRLISSAVIWAVALISNCHAYRMNVITAAQKFDTGRRIGVYQLHILDQRFWVNELFKRGAMRAGMIPVDNKMGRYNWHWIPADTLQEFIATLRRCGNFNGHRLWDIYYNDADDKWYLQLNDTPFTKVLFQLINCLHDFWGAYKAAGAGMRFAEWSSVQSQFTFS